MAASISQVGMTTTVSVVRFASTGAIAAGTFFLLCWLGLFVPFGSPTHAYLTLFTSAELTSGLALGQGLCWSIVFGAVAGTLIALSYNILSRFGVR